MPTKLRASPRGRRSRRRAASACLRRLSEVVAVLAFPASFALVVGWPSGEPAAAVVVVLGLVLALLQYGRGYRRASGFVLGSAVVGLLTGHFVSQLVA